MTAEHELAGNAGFLWAVAYVFLLTVVFGFGAWWILKGTVRWVQREPHLRRRRAGLVAGFAAVGGLATLSRFLGDGWALTFAIVCLLLSYGANHLERRGVL